RVQGQVAGALPLSEGRHARLHQGGLRLPRLDQQGEGGRRRRGGRQRRRREVAREVRRGEQGALPAARRSRQVHREGLRRAHVHLRLPARAPRHLRDRSGRQGREALPGRGPGEERGSGGGGSRGPEGGEVATRVLRRRSMRPALVCASLALAASLASADTKIVYAEDGSEKAAAVLYIAADRMRMELPDAGDRFVLFDAKAQAL